MVVVVIAMSFLHDFLILSPEGFDLLTQRSISSLDFLGLLLNELRNVFLRCFSACLGFFLGY
jgi:hypothetical protein